MVALSGKAVFQIPLIYIINPKIIIKVFEEYEQPRKNLPPDCPGAADLPQ
jgi:hypothetical protein